MKDQKEIKGIMKASTVRGLMSQTDIQNKPELIPDFDRDGNIISYHS